MRISRKYLMKLGRRRWVRVVGAILAVFAVWWIAMFIVVPARLFSDPYSTLLYSREGHLLGGRIATDGQWRFPQADSLPEKFITCLTQFEDKRYYHHPGIDPIAIGRAVRLNLSSGSVVSGGSTITMQLARVARGNRDRNLYEKAVEMCWALFLETKYSKREILNLYASHAPFGGNIVGVETAAWKYFGRSSFDLSWAESAVLAVLPNSPALIHPGRNRDQLRAKRDFLLRKLMERGIIDNTEYELACMEPLPDVPLPLPDAAPHFLERMASQARARREVDMRLGSSLDYNLQLQAQTIANRYASQYSSQHIHNVAAIIADTETGEILAYVGNASFTADPRHGNSVDVAAAERSTGSILKPLLYAGMLNDGLILPRTLVSDTPLNINGFIPQNYNKTYYGSVHADRAIARSLNVPLVRMLSQYNTGRFMSLLRNYGMTTLRFSEDHYGASIILGGAEGTLYDMVGIYASMSRTLNHFRPYNGRYDKRDVHSLRTQVIADDQEPIRSVTDKRLSDKPLLNAASIWFAFEAMSEVNRPEEEADWQQFSSMKKIAWKTGTSYGGRDAWAVGTTPRYTIGVWVGNASGEGRSGLTGVGYAAPILFDLLSLLPSGRWFDMPLDEMEKTPVCRRSGHKASMVCDLVDTLYIPRRGIETDICPYHRKVHLSKDGMYRVNTSCENPADIVTASWFVLPPAQEYYFRNYNFDYRPLPPVKPGCAEAGSRTIELIYPEHSATLFLPKGFSGDYEKFIFKAAHSRPEATLYWYIDNQYIGATSDDHSIECSPARGKHLLTLTDDQGTQRKISFTVK